MALTEETVKVLKSKLRQVRGLRAAYLVRKVIDDPEFSIDVWQRWPVLRGVRAGNQKHLEPLFEELVNIPELPSPIAFLSLDLQHGYLLPKFAGTEGAELFATEDVGVTVRH